MRFLLHDIIYNKTVKTAILFWNVAERGIRFQSEDSHALRLTSELVDLRAANANPLLICFANQKAFKSGLSLRHAKKAPRRVPCVAEREGFEPSCACAQTDFESAPL